MRTIGDFISARIAHVGFKTIGEAARKADMARPTLYRVMKAEDPEELQSYRITLERLANVLRFFEWAKLVEAWKADDVLRGVGFDYYRIPTGVLEGLRARAAQEKSTLDEWLERQATLNVEVYDEPDLPESQARAGGKRGKGSGRGRNRGRLEYRDK